MTVTWSVSDQVLLCATALQAGAAASPEKRERREPPNAKTAQRDAHHLRYCHKPYGIGVSYGTKHSESSETYRRASSEEILDVRSQPAVRCADFSGRNQRLPVFAPHCSAHCLVDLPGGTLSRVSRNLLGVCRDARHRRTKPHGQSAISRQDRRRAMRGFDRARRRRRQYMPEKEAQLARRALPNRTAARARSVPGTRTHGAAPVAPS